MNINHVRGWLAILVGCSRVRKRRFVKSLEKFSICFCVRVCVCACIYRRNMNKMRRRETNYKIYFLYSALLSCVCVCIVEICKFSTIIIHPQIIRVKPRMFHVNIVLSLSLSFSLIRTNIE